MYSNNIRMENTFSKHVTSPSLLRACYWFVFCVTPKSPSRNHSGWRGCLISSPCLWSGAHQAPLPHQRATSWGWFGTPQKAINVQFAHCFFVGRTCVRIVLFYVTNSVSVTSRRTISVRRARSRLGRTTLCVLARAPWSCASLGWVGGVVGNRLWDSEAKQGSVLKVIFWGLRWLTS